MAESGKLWELRQSGVHGTGVFALYDIASGTPILEYIGEKIDKETSNNRCLEWEKQARETGEGLVYVFELDDDWDLDGNVPGNPAKYINHSCNENCEAINEENRIFIYAKKDIKAGDELTFDYGYGIEHFLDHPCRCGAKNCVGYIVGKDSRKTVKQILRRNKSEKARRKAAEAAAAE